MAIGFWADDPEVRASLHQFTEVAREMPTPNHMSLIMPDLAPSQFLTNDGRITALIDTESYVRGPAELELAVVELWTENPEAFRAGYLEVNDIFPRIGDCREAYRYFIYLLYNAPPKGLSKWLEAPEYFD